MTGRAEVARLRQALDATFGRLSSVPSEPEVLSDFARYLCILVSGFLEQAVQELVLEHVRKRSSPTVQRYVDSRMRRFTNAKTQRLIQLLGSYDPDWRRDLETFLVDQRKDAVDSVVNLRNTIAHGRYAGITLSRVGHYYSEIKVIIDHIAALCDPE